MHICMSTEHVQREFSVNAAIANGMRTLNSFICILTAPPVAGTLWHPVFAELHWSICVHVFAIVLILLPLPMGDTKCSQAAPGFSCFKLFLQLSRRQKELTAQQRQRKTINKHIWENICKAQLKGAQMKLTWVTCKMGRRKEYRTSSVMCEWFPPKLCFFLFITSVLLSQLSKSLLSTLKNLNVKIHVNSEHENYENMN